MDPVLVNILLSGGIDSTACTHFMLSQGYEVQTTFVDFGQPASQRERKSAESISSYFDIPLTEIKLSTKKTYQDGEIFARNGFLIFTALLTMESSKGLISTGIHSGTSYYDCSSSFSQQLNKIIKESSDGLLSLSNPFLDWNKNEIYKYFTNNKLPLHLTYSCETNSRQPCETCLSCQDRKALEC